MVKLVYKNQIEAHCTKIITGKSRQGDVRKAWVPKRTLWRVSLAGSSENIRSAVAEMRGAIENSGYLGTVYCIIIVLFPRILR